MSLHRAALVAFAALFMAGSTSVAFAGCCGWEPPAPIAYAPPPPPVAYAAPCGGCAAFAPCGGCGAPIAAPVTYAPPVAPVPVAAPPVVATPLAATPWGIGGCGCAGPVAYAAPVVALPPPIVPAPIYVVDQGPDYTGPGIMVTYRTWSPAAAYAPAIGFPYVVPPAYGYRYVPPRRHYAYLRIHRSYPAQHWRRYPHRPLRARD